MSLDKYCFAELGDHEEICASSRKFGGIKSIFLIKQGQTTITDWTSNTQWDAAIADGSVVIIKEIKGEYAQPSETTTESQVACEPDVLDSYTHTLTWRDRAVTATNTSFYNDLNQFTAGGIGWWECKNGETKVIEDESIRFMVKPEVLADDKTVQIFAGSAMWDTIDIFSIYDEPTNAEEIFD